MWRQGGGTPVDHCTARMSDPDAFPPLRGPTGFAPDPGLSTRGPLVSPSVTTEGAVPVKALCRALVVAPAAPWSAGAPSCSVSALHGAGDSNPYRRPVAPARGHRGRGAANYTSSTTCGSYSAGPLRMISPSLPLDVSAPEARHCSGCPICTALRAYEARVVLLHYTRCAPLATVAMDYPPGGWSCLLALPCMGPH